MKRSKHHTSNHRHLSRGATIRCLAVAATLLLNSSCREQEQDVFERRYSLVRIPSFELADYAERLDHEDANVRYLAVANLLKMGVLAEPSEGSAGGEEVAQLAGKLRELMDDPAPKVRAIASYAPINRAGDGAEAKLLEKLNDPYSAVRVEAAVALGGEKSSRRRELSAAGTTQVTALLDDENLLVRLHALETLAATAAPEQGAAIVEKIEHTSMQREIPEILKALETLGKIDGDRAEAFLTEQLAHQDPRIVGVAVASLAGRESPALETWLLERLAGAEAPEPHLLANLAEVATRRSRAFAASKLTDPDPAVRSECAAILVKIGDRGSFDALATHVDSLVEALTAEEFEEIEGELVELIIQLTTLGTELELFDLDRAGLSSLLQSKRPHGQLVALLHLIEINYHDSQLVSGPAGAPSFLPPLEALTASESPLIRRLAFSALGKSGNPAVGRILLEAFDDPSPTIRLTVLEALVDFTSTTGQPGPLRSIHSQRSQFKPTTFADDDLDLELRQDIEEAVRQFEPAWASAERASAELRADGDSTTQLLAAAYLAPRADAMGVLLDTLAGGTDGAKNFAVEALAEHATEEHLPRLREILGSETDPLRKRWLNDIISWSQERTP